MPPSLSGILTKIFLPTKTFLYYNLPLDFTAELIALNDIGCADTPKI